MHFTLSDLIMDITQNAAESGAALVELEVREKELSDPANPGFCFVVKDNGKGMDPDELKRAEDPFTTDGIKHPHRKIGLGLPFLIQTAEQSGGGWDIKSEKGRGTLVSAWFDTANVDTPPVGDMPGMFRTVFLFEGPEEVVIRRILEGKKRLSYELRKTELVEAVGGLDDTQSLLLLDQYLHSIEEEE